jgi:hypothetical protein
LIEKPQAPDGPVVLPLPNEPDASTSLPALDAGEAGAGNPPGLDAGAQTDASAPDAGLQVRALTVAAAADSVALGRTLALSASARLVGDAGADVTSLVEWTSSDESIAYVEDGQLVTVSVGSVEISASYEGVSSEPIVIEVTEAELVSLSIEASEEVAGPGQVKLLAMGTFTDGSEADLSEQVVWASVDESIVTVDETGLTTAQSPGSTEVTATLGEISDSIPFDVTEESAAGTDAGAP